LDHLDSYQIPEDALMTVLNLKPGTRIDAIVYQGSNHSMAHIIYDSMNADDVLTGKTASLNESNVRIKIHQITLEKSPIGFNEDGWYTVTIKGEIV